MRIAFISRELLFSEALASLADEAAHAEAICVLNMADLISNGVTDIGAIVLDMETVTPEEVPLIEGAVASRGISLYAVRAERAGLAPQGAKIVQDSAESFVSSMRALAESRFLTYGISDSRKRSGARRLGARELQVAKLVAQGLSNREIATRTELQEQSVKNLVSTLLRKTGVENRTQLALAFKDQ